MHVESKNNPRLKIRGDVNMPRILLVEDNEMNRDMLSRRLQRKGYSVVIAVDGEQAVNAFARILNVRDQGRVEPFGELIL